MADEQQLGILRQGAEAWNAWRRQTPAARVDLRGATLNLAILSGTDLSEADLSGATLIGATLSAANLVEADLSRANLTEADLSLANLTEADLSAAILREAILREANLFTANLRRANLRRANLCQANLREANLRRADLSEGNLTEADLSLANLSAANLHDANVRAARFFETTLSDVDLSRCQNLASIVHEGPSSLDSRTLQRSESLPLAFLRGVGLQEKLIEYLPSLLDQAIQFYSCFISYASKDDAFARRLHADLQDKGVRCWFDAEDMKIGAKIRDVIEEAIRLRDRVLLVLSETSIASTWVEGEVEKAFEEERQRGGLVLFPVRLDDAVLTTKSAWASHLRRTRHIGDFRTWKDHDAYQHTLAAAVA